MLPRWHILYGAVFTAIIWFLVPETKIFYLVLIFFSSFIMDFDHYVASVLKTKKLFLFHSFKYHEEQRKKELADKKKGITGKGDFHFFHTIEFHIVVGLLALFWNGFFYIFIGMVFHSLLDLAWLLHMDRLYRREYFFFNWLRKNI